MACLHWSVKVVVQTQVHLSIYAAYTQCEKLLCAPWVLYFPCCECLKNCAAGPSPRLGIQATSGQPSVLRLQQLTVILTSINLHNAKGASNSEETRKREEVE
jgi:hypothetical protein